MSPKRVSVIFVLLALTSLTRLARAEDKLVPAVFAEIQAAIDSASAGQDRVVITQPGALPYAPFVLDKAVPVLKSTSEEVVVDAGYSAAYAASVAAAGASIQGLTLRGGIQGVVNVVSGSVQNCIVQDAAVPYSNGAVRIYAGAFVANTVNLTSGSGRAVVVWDADRVAQSTVWGNTIQVALSSPQWTEAIRIGPTLQNYINYAYVGGNTIMFTGAKQGIGIKVDYGENHTVADNTIIGADKGIVVDFFSGGGHIVQYNVVDNSNEGVVLESQALVRYNTVGLGAPDPCGGVVTRGIRVIPGGFARVWNNLLYNAEIGIECAGSTANLEHNIYWSGNPCGVPADRAVTVAEISVIEPTFCWDREGTGRYTHRIDSAVAPGNNPWSEWVGAEGCGCAWGTITRDASLTYGETATVVEDVTVPAGRTLALHSGSALRFDDDDESGGGFYSTKTELLVDGSLTSQYATLGSVSGTPAVGDWGAVVVRRGGRATIQDTEFVGAETAIRAEDTADADIDGGQIRTCTNAVTCVDSSSVTVSGLTTGPNVKKGVQLLDSSHGQVTGSTLAVNGPLSDGVTVSGSAVLTNLTNTSISAARYGVVVTGGSALLGSGTDVSQAGTGVLATGGETFVTGGTYHDMDTGVWTDGGAIRMYQGTIEDCTWGAWVEGAGGQLTLGQAWGDLAESTQVLIRRCGETGVGIDSQGPNQLTQVRVEGGDEDYWTGIQVLPDAGCTMTRCSVANATGTGAVGMLIESQATLHAPKVENFLGNLSAGIRIDTDSLVAVTIDSVTTADDLWRNPKIQYCYYGLDVTGTSEPRIRGALVDTCRTNVNIGVAAVPDLGHDWQADDFGNNTIKRAITRLAGSRLTRVSGIPDVPAEKNYWGSTIPDASKISAWVDYFPYLQQNPLGQSRILVQIGPIGTTPSVVQSAYPMPFTDRVNVPLVVGSVNEPVEAGVFDVAGRRIRTLQSGPLSMGTHVLAWDGLTDDGSHASSGVYFVRVRLGNAESTQKLVLAR